MAHSWAGIETIVHAAGVLQDGLIVPNLQKAGGMIGRWEGP